MATPHVAGVAAQLLQKHKGSKLAAQAELFSVAVSRKIKDAKSGSTNLLLQVAGDYTGPPTKAPTFGPTPKPPGFCTHGAGQKNNKKFCPGIKTSLFGPSLPETLLTEHKLVYPEEVFGASYKEGCRNYR